MNIPDLAPPANLRNWLAAADRTPQLLDDSVDVDSGWWCSELATHGFPNTVTADTVSRADLFELGAAAAESAEGAIALLWNSIAFCQGRRTGEGRRRITAVGADRERIGSLLQQAAKASRDDPARAFALLKPERGGTTVERLGPSGFTWFLYFAGAGNPTHPCPVLDAEVARTLRRSGWDGLHKTTWSAAEYASYSRLVDRWRRECGVERNDVIVRGLIAVAPAPDADYPWQAWQRQTETNDDWVNGPLSRADLGQIYHWLALVADAYPSSTAAQDFSKIGGKIKSVLGAELDTGLRLRESVPHTPYDDGYPARYR